MTEKSSKKIGLLIVTYKNPSIFKRVKKYASFFDYIIIIDNSPPEYLYRVKREYEKEKKYFHGKLIVYYVWPKIRLQEYYLGIAKKIASQYVDWVFHIDDDMIPDKNLLAHLRDIIDRAEREGYDCISFPVVFKSLETKETLITSIYLKLINVKKARWAGAFAWYFFCHKNKIIYKYKIINTIPTRFMLLFKKYLWYNKLELDNIPCKIGIVIYLHKYKEFKYIGFRSINFFYKYLGKFFDKENVNTLELFAGVFFYNMGVIYRSILPLLKDKRGIRKLFSPYGLAVILFRLLLFLQLPKRIPDLKKRFIYGRILGRCLDNKFCYVNFENIKCGEARE